MNDEIIQTLDIIDNKVESIKSLVNSIRKDLESK